MQRRRLSRDAALADLMFGFEPITNGIAFATVLQTILENLIRPLADLRVRTGAYHGFLLPLWLTGGTPAASMALQGPFLMDQASQSLPHAVAGIFTGGGLFDYSFFSPLHPPL